jgi:hypothetical protein
MRQIAPMNSYLYSKTDASPLWRVFHLKHLLSFLQDGLLYFLRPQKWDDPFENVLLKQKYHQAFTNNILNFDTQLDRFFGQCWTNKREETDATWRIYAPDKMGIRVRSSVERLHNSLAPAVQQLNGILRVCRVDYFDAEVIARNARLCMELKEALKDHEMVISLLTVKRPEFSHEEEVRVLLEDIQQSIPLAQDYVLLKVDPFSLIEDLVVDPRIAPADFDRIRKEAIALGVRVSISHSDLYRLPDIDIPIY